jgi:hypothetical protein
VQGAGTLVHTSYRPLHDTRQAGAVECLEELRGVHPAAGPPSPATVPGTASCATAAADSPGTASFATAAHVRVQGRVGESVRL